MSKINFGFALLILVFAVSIASTIIALIYIKWPTISNNTHVYCFRARRIFTRFQECTCNCLRSSTCCLFDACCGRNVEQDRGTGVPASDYNSSTDSSDNDMYRSQPLSQSGDDERFENQDSMERGVGQRRRASDPERQNLTCFPPFTPQENRGLTSILRKPTSVQNRKITWSQDNKPTSNQDKKTTSNQKKKTASTSKQKTTSDQNKASPPAVTFTPGALAAAPKRRDRGRLVHFNDLDRVQGGVEFGGNAEDSDEGGSNEMESRRRKSDERENHKRESDECSLFT
ncbi:hypothetical protein P154DRAFT_576786 [Amniculicola lignicola CBS 123094]|uniref:Uncharacterized protein n=1 Tax=Amniculicola lignicola CBS 123094 TaxID=1392246 RepID=A0A6A5WPS0_9PLEO|nr:hypothetical protein P154DRAFT_576786 [Amniculicola lignicola CBS 123094]